MDPIEMFKNGEEPLLLKICAGTATEEEIEEWANEQNIVQEEINQVIDLLKESFSNGAEIAQNIVNIPDKTEQLGIKNKLNGILTQLNDIKCEVEQLLEIMDEVHLN